MNAPLAQQTLGQLARDIPGATALFHRHALDFCCGGQQRLDAAASDAGLPLDKLLKALEALRAQPSDEIDWQAQPTGALIEHILTRYHARHRQQLAELVRLADRVEQVHGAHPLCPHGLGDFLHALHEDLENHMQKEEQVLFPMLERGYGGMAGGPIGVMREEHEQHRDALQTLRRLSHGLTLPEGACNTWTALYLGLDELIQDLMQHIHLENNILFERG